jgi:hypothetical protein
MEEALGRTSSFVRRHSSLQSHPMKRAAAALVALTMLVIACGKRGDPRPPVPVIPKATSDLVVTQRGPKLVLSWSYPSLTTAGANLRHIRHVVIYRYVENLPVPSAAGNPAPPAEIDLSRPREHALFSKVPLLSPTQFMRLREKVESIDEANLAGATVGSRLFYEDTPPLRTADNRPVRITYAVTTEGETGKSDLSNLAAVVPLDVAVAPSGLTATPRAAGVVLKWTAPAAGVSGASKPVLTGYNVYRFGEAEEPDTLGAPLNASPVRETTYQDVPPYGKYRYLVTAVANEGPPRLESEPSEVASATFKDLQPPPPPANLNALVEVKAVRLVWDAVDAPDLSGYAVYRIEGTIKLRLTPIIIPQTNFRDISPDIGITYSYEVTSIDKSGNESAPATVMNVLVPKTP